MNTLLKEMNTELRQSSLASRPLPNPSPASSSDNPLKTSNPPTEPLCTDDFPDVSFWKFSDWTKHREEHENGGESVGKLDFLTDENGEVCTKERKKDFSRYAYELWNQLYLHRLDPISWTKRVPSASTYYYEGMKSRFIEFCYCEGDWKAEHFAIARYPDWANNQRDSGKLTRM
jgi:hypothetical protein